MKFRESETNKDERFDATTNWPRVERIAAEIINAALRRDRIDLIDDIFHLCAELACVEGAGGNGKFGWNDDFGIICEDLNEADAIANLFDAMYEEQVCCTSEWNRKDDERYGEVDEWTGHANVCIW